MPFVVRNKETGLFVKVRKKGWPRGTEWVADVNDATTYRNEGAALISCGKHTKSNEKQNIRAKIEEHNNLMTSLYGPMNGVYSVSRKSGEERTITGGWPEEEKKKHYRMCNRYDHAPFGHMVLPENLEIVPVSFVQVGIIPFSKE